MSEGDRYDPILCPREEKAEREAANGLQQIDYLTYLVTDLKVRDVRESHVLELQKLAIDGIYPCGGIYRDARTVIRISNSQHVPPESAFVPSHVREMLEVINERSRPPLERAAYALWRLNWIHPFRGGNGRTSRCIAYLILCLDMEAMLPGLPTLPTLIYDRRNEYVAALQAADASERNRAGSGTADSQPKPDLSIMIAYLQDLVLQQLASVTARISEPVR